MAATSIFSRFPFSRYIQSIKRSITRILGKNWWYLRKLRQAWKRVKRIKVKRKQLKQKSFRDFLSLHFCNIVTVFSLWKFIFRIQFILFPFPREAKHRLKLISHSDCNRVDWAEGHYCILEHWVVHVWKWKFQSFPLAYRFPRLFCSAPENVSENDYAETVIPNLHNFGTIYRAGVLAAAAKGMRPISDLCQCYVNLHLPCDATSDPSWKAKALLRGGVSWFDFDVLLFGINRAKC